MFPIITGGLHSNRFDSPKKKKMCCLTLLSALLGGASIALLVLIADPQAENTYYATNTRLKCWTLTPHIDPYPCCEKQKCHCIGEDQQYPPISCRDMIDSLTEGICGAGLIDILCDYGRECTVKCTTCFTARLDATCLTLKTFDECKANETDIYTCAPNMAIHTELSNKCDFGANCTQSWFDTQPPYQVIVDAFRQPDGTIQWTSLPVYGMNPWIVFGIVLLSVWTCVFVCITAGLIVNEFN